MRIHLSRHGTTNSLYVTVAASLGLLVVLGFMLFSGPNRSYPPGFSANSKRGLLLFCAAGMRYPIERIAADYEREYGVTVEAYNGDVDDLVDFLTKPFQILHIPQEIN